MPKFVIERDLPGAGKLSRMELKGIAQRSCEVLRSMGPRIAWQHSYVTGDKLYCIYIADSEEDIREHARMGGFPVTSVRRVGDVIDAATAD